MDPLLIALALLPVVVLAWVVYRQDKYAKEPIRQLAKAFLFGCLAVIPASLVEGLLSLFAPGMPVVDGIYTGFVVAGCTEEACKMLMLYWAIWKSREFDEYFDGIVYACFVSLGFACVENFGYVFGQEAFQDAMAVGSVRAVLSVPGHFLFGVMMGYHFALAKFDVHRRPRHLWHAFLFPMLMHGTFDSLLMVPEQMEQGVGIVTGVLFVLFIWFDVKMWKWGIRRIRLLQDLSRQQGENRHLPFSGFIWK